MRDMGGAPFVPEGTDRERVFRAAMRHSRMVRLFRGAIPVSLIAIMATIVAAAYVQPLRILSKLPVDAGRLVVSGNEITMESPHLGGFTRDGRPYDLTARAASQDRTNPAMLELKGITARVAMQDKTTVDITAATGTYDTKGDMMVLRTDVVVTSSAGYTARLHEAKVDIKANRIVSDQPVVVTMSTGTIKSNRLEVSDNGDVMRFDGDVDVDLVPQAAPAAPAGPAQPAASAASTGPTAGPKTRR
jgi:lipopolysaccharide export system protein LptC